MANEGSSGCRRDNDLPQGSSQDADQGDEAKRSVASAEGSGAVSSRKEESSFSFKHFLRNSADAANTSNGVSAGVSIAAPSATTTTTTSTTSTSSVNSATGSKITPRGSLSSASGTPNLGARPKVPHYSLHNGLDQQLPRMKRSPKFPSFDSHASLSEYSEEVSSSFVQRSHSNYEVETPSAASFNRRSPVPHQGPREPSVMCNSPSAGARNTNDFQAALPDFVKDHMVLEQWYQTNPFRSGDANDLTGGSLSPAPPDGDLEPLSRRNFPSSNLFDLAMGSASGAGVGGGTTCPFRLATNSPTVPLDLPNHYDDRVPLDLPHHSRFNAVDRHANPSNSHAAGGGGGSASGDLPLDLTERHRVNSRLGHRDAESPPPQVQADMIQTLPDFLSDGPIHSSGRMADVAQDLPQLDSPEENAAVNVISRLRLENDRLRHELDEARRLISDQGRQITDLERTCRNGEIQRNGTVLERNKLKQKIAQLTEEVGTLRQVNESLREEGSGAVGGNSSDKESLAAAAAASQRRPSQRMAQLLSMELKLAAGSAEANLRQLLAGVENLKALARRVELGVDCDDADSIDDYISDGLDEDDFLGGAGGASGM